MTKSRRNLSSIRAISSGTTRVVLMAMGVIVFAAGCQREPSGATPAAVSEPDPKAMFDEIFKAFRHEIISDLPQFSTMKDGDFSSLKIHRTVAHELFPPADADATFRANITIKTETKFTFRPSQKEGDVEKEEGSKKTGDLPESSGFGLPILGGIDGTGDAASTAGSVGIFPAGPLPPQENEDVQVYELAFEDGRWVLETEPDPETERFIKATFDFVLSNQ